MKKLNVIIVHGAYGYPEENWFGWLQRELHHLKIECLVPQLPTPEGQHLNAWMEVFTQAIKHTITSDTILIGHSLGAVFILRWLEEKQYNIAAVVLAGAFQGAVNKPQFDEINKSFFQAPFNWDMIKNTCNDITCYYGTQDMYVGREQFDVIASCLNAKKIIVSKAGHFHTASNYKTFPHILQLIKHRVK